MNDLEFLRNVDEKPLNLYLKGLIPAEKADILRWRTTQIVRPDEQMKFTIMLKAMRKSVSDPKPSHQPLEVTPIRAEQFWIEKAREEVDFFVEYVSGKAPARHHKIWLANIFHPDYKLLNIIAPPGSSKTTILVYALAYHMGYNPLTTNSLISVSSTQAESRMEMLKNIIAFNKAYENVFPHIEIDQSRPSNTQEFSLRVREQRMPYSEWQTLMQQQGEPHDPTFKAAGYGGKAIIGSRWSGICGIDDIVDESMLSAEMQRKVGTYILQTLLSRLVPRKGRVVTIGTRWMLGDVAQQLKENPSFRTLEFPAERIVNGERKSYWPEYWPIETLDEVIKSLSATSLYQTNYMCNPTAASMQKFTSEMLSLELPWELPVFKAVFISTDFALSVAQKADYTVYQAIGVDALDNYYILDQRRYKEGPDDTPALLGLFADEIASRYGRLDDIIIESVAFSGTMGNLLRQKRPDLPFTKFVPKGDKAHRASLVADVARNNKLFINQLMPDIAQFKLEWLNFGSAAHDDTLDPMGLLLQFQGMSQVSAKFTVVKSPFML